MVVRKTKARRSGRLHLLLAPLVLVGLVALDVRRARPSSRSDRRVGQHPPPSTEGAGARDTTTPGGHLQLPEHRGGPPADTSAGAKIILGEDLKYIYSCSPDRVEQRDVFGKYTTMNFRKVMRTRI